MSDEFDFNDSHKDSFVRAKKTEPTKAKKVAPSAPAKPKEKVVDDIVPEKVGQVVDNVFGKLDNLVNDAADYLFGNKTKPSDLTPKNKALPPLKTKTPPVPEFKVQPPHTPTAPKPAAKVEPSKPKPGVKPTITHISTLQSSRQPEMIKGVMPESKSKSQGPVISRTTAISELDLPLEILDDPDLARYFDQMKLYENHAIKGGLCNLSKFEAEHLLKKGHWKNKFLIKFNDLKKVDPGIYPLEMARSRFNGMKPVYKTLAAQYPSKAHLVHAIEDDINAYLKGKKCKHFHKFIYQVITSRS